MKNFISLSLLTGLLILINACSGETEQKTVEPKSLSFFVENFSDTLFLKATKAEFTGGSLRIEIEGIFGERCYQDGNIDQSWYLTHHHEDKYVLHNSKRDSIIIAPKNQILLAKFLGRPNASDSHLISTARKLPTFFVKRINDSMGCLGYERYNGRRNPRYTTYSTQPFVFLK